MKRPPGDRPSLNRATFPGKKRDGRHRHRSRRHGLGRLFPTFEQLLDVLDLGDRRVSLAGEPLVPRDHVTFHGRGAVFQAIQPIVDLVEQLIDLVKPLVFRSFFCKPLDSVQAGL
jgi:hypothetical protein